MRVVWVVAAMLTACSEEDAPEGLSAVATGHFRLVVGQDQWIGDEAVRIETESHDVLCTDGRDLDGVGLDIEGCEDCDVTLDVVGVDEVPEACALAPETLPQVWIPSRWVSFVPESRTSGVAVGTLRVSDDGNAWEDWSDSATFGQGIIMYQRLVPLTIERPEDFEPREQQPPTVP